MKENDFGIACDKYDTYLKEHKDNVIKGYTWLKRHKLIPTAATSNICDNIIRYHDDSKYSAAEYGPYVEYFYGARTHEVEKRFNIA